MKICFIDNGKAYKPELHAYQSYFSRLGVSVETVTTSRDADADAIEWRFAGFDPFWQPCIGAAVVHDYASLSVPPFVALKNLAKRWVNRKPSLRVFLNAEVDAKFGFHGEVPKTYRDMGVDKSFFLPRSEHAAKNYDFVYVGSVSKLRCVSEAFDWVLNNNLGSILVIGEPDVFVREKYANNPEIYFAGRVPYLEIPRLASQATFGLNWVPDKHPFNLQTSTKLLEYCALNMPVVSNRYHWVEKFCRARRGEFLFFNPSEGMQRDELERFGFITPCIDDLEWEHLLSAVGGIGLHQVLKNALEIR